MSLDRANADPGYRLGRLFAVLESDPDASARRQYQCHHPRPLLRRRLGDAGRRLPASAAQRQPSSGAACARTVRAAWRFTVEREIGEILDRFSDQLPRNLRIEEQGRFAIGYYHQRFAKRDRGIDDDRLPNRNRHPEDEE